MPGRDSARNIRPCGADMKDTEDQKGGAAMADNKNTDKNPSGTAAREEEFKRALYDMALKFTSATRGLDAAVRTAEDAVDKADGEGRGDLDTLKRVQEQLYQEMVQAVNDWTGYADDIGEETPDIEIDEEKEIMREEGRGILKATHGVTAKVAHELENSPVGKAMSNIRKGITHIMRAHKEHRIARTIERARREGIRKEALQESGYVRTNLHNGLLRRIETALGFEAGSLGNREGLPFLTKKLIEHAETKSDRLLNRVQKDLTEVNMLRRESGMKELHVRDFPRLDIFGDYIKDWEETIHGTPVHEYGDSEKVRKTVSPGKVPEAMPGAKDVLRTPDGEPLEDGPDPEVLDEEARKLFGNALPERPGEREEPEGPEEDDYDFEIPEEYDSIPEDEDLTEQEQALRQSLDMQAANVAVLIEQGTVLTEDQRNEEEARKRVRDYYTWLENYFDHGGDLRSLEDMLGDATAAFVNNGWYDQDSVLQIRNGLMLHAAQYYVNFVRDYEHLNTVSVQTLRREAQAMMNGYYELNRDEEAGSPLFEERTNPVTASAIQSVRDKDTGEIVLRPVTKVLYEQCEKMDGEQALAYLNYADALLHVNMYQEEAMRLKMDPEVLADMPPIFTEENIRTAFESEDLGDYYRAKTARLRGERDARRMMRREWARARREQVRARRALGAR